MKFGSHPFLIFMISQLSFSTLVQFQFNHHGRRQSGGPCALRDGLTPILKSGVDTKNTIPLQVPRVCVCTMVYACDYVYECVCARVGDYQ